MVDGDARVVHSCSLAELNLEPVESGDPSPKGGVNTQPQMHFKSFHRRHRLSSRLMFVTCLQIHQAARLVILFES